MLIKDIKGYPGYKIYSDGRVWSDKTNKFLTPRDNSRNYLQVYLTNEDGSSNFFVHRLVAKAFIMEDIPEGFDVDHINRDTHDNRLDNLRVITHRRNVERGKRKSVVCIETGTVYYSMTYASLETGIAKAYITMACSNKYPNKTAGGYHWRYATEEESEVFGD